MLRHSLDHDPPSNRPLYSCYRLDGMDNMTSHSRSVSPASRPIPSGRKGSKKVRTGCITCKIRKVKCDETKPFCVRCTKTGRKCDGYLDPRSLTKRHRVKDIMAPHDHILGPLIEFSAPEEKRAFFFFENVTAPCISGDFDAGFWRVIVLQISQTEPAVRHAVLAVSSLHEGLSAPSTTQEFALQQYNQAIARLLDQLNNNPLSKPLASLLTCVLFVCIEYMQGKDKESLIHLEQGRQLLARLPSQQRSTNDPEMQCIVRHIVPLYTRLSLTSFLFGGSPVPIPESLKSRTQRDVPDVFDSIDAVRRCMDEFMEQAFRFTQLAQPAKNSNSNKNIDSSTRSTTPRETMRRLEVEQDRLLARHARLNVAFSLFRASNTSNPPFQAYQHQQQQQQQQHAMLVIQMYLHAQHIWISTALSSSEVAYDDFLSSFAAIVPLAAAYLDLEEPGMTMPPSTHHHPSSSSGHTATTSDFFTFETHIIPPLYYVATKCRHPLIRRSALDLLRRNPYRRENLWRASAMGALAGHIVSLEEGWAATAAADVHVSTSSGVPAMSVDSSSLFTDVEVLSRAPPSLEDGGGALDFLTPSTNLYAHNQQYEYSSHSPGSSDASSSSLDADEEQQAYFQYHHQPSQQPPTASRSYYGSYMAEHHQQEQRHHQYAEDYYDARRHWQQQRSSPPPPPPTRHVSTEAPFGLPEELRVHDAVIMGPGSEEGSWVAVFRKLHGADAEWAVQQDWVAMV